ncbi:unnamed protein product [Psylliodes chrysocephalus]|uniref:Mutator-like transposase domain-containing protein n=1 Tax=Psylliodes chrysocephalus TaxID=3402493 RepID=A0A9P0GF59_9CUCU|nr:unnamed protein product [Psylliodes chrysocephala]
MEADRIAEEFSKSLELYGIIFEKLIADRDSNCYQKILDTHPYNNIVVKKIECKNHLLRNYSRKLRDLTKVESVNAIITKFIGSKRIYYGHRRSYRARCFAAVVNKNTRMPLYTLRTCLGRKVGKFGKTFEFKKLRKIIRKKKRIQKINKTDNDESYGQFCQKPDLPEEDLIKETNEFLDTLKKSNEEIEFL